MQTISNELAQRSVMNHQQGYGMDLYIIIIGVHRTALIYLNKPKPWAENWEWIDKGWDRKRIDNRKQRIDKGDR